MIILFAIFITINANENITAVHYSIVSPGIDNTLAACKLFINDNRYSCNNILILTNNNLASFNWHCEGCTVNARGDAVEIKNRYLSEPTLYNVSVDLNLSKNQHVRQE